MTLGRILWTGTAALLSVAAIAGPELTPFQQHVKRVMAMEHRGTANRARDANRDPVRALEFCGMRENLKVIEFGPGTGWYTEILGPLLKGSGSLYAAHNAQALERLDKLLSLDVMSAVRKAPVDVRYNRARRKFDVGVLDFGITGADLALNIREYHNFDAEGARRLNEAVFAALRPGGRYCIIDHTRRHMQPDDAENRRRADPVRVIMQVQAAGFRLHAYSDVFYRPDDELRFEVGRRTVTGNTDRLMMVFVKPGG